MQLGCCCCCKVSSVVSDSVRPHRWQHTRLCCPWDSPGKNAGVGCHFLLQCMKVKSESEVAQSCPTLSDPVDCRLLHPWDFPGKSTGVGCHCLLWQLGWCSAKEIINTSACLIRLSSCLTPLVGFQQCQVSSQTAVEAATSVFPTLYPKSSYTM